MAFQQLLHHAQYGGRDLIDSLLTPAGIHTETPIADANDHPDVHHHDHGCVNLDPGLGAVGYPGVDAFGSVPGRFAGTSHTSKNTHSISSFLAPVDSQNHSGTSKGGTDYHLNHNAAHSNLTSTNLNFNLTSFHSGPRRIAHVGNTNFNTAAADTNSNTAPNVLKPETNNASNSNTATNGNILHSGSSGSGGGASAGPIDSEMRQDLRNEMDKLRDGIFRKHDMGAAKDWGTKLTGFQEGCFKEGRKGDCHVRRKSESLLFHLAASKRGGRATVM
jgi:hypothetical protein